MPAGTIALTNNSTTVTGTGTSFTTELKVNDFVVAIVGGVAYTLGVAAIASNTSLTLIQKYDGPTTSGLTWNPVPFGTMTAITAQLAAQVTYAIRGLNLDKANWQQVYTGTGNITVNLPDGSSYTGPAWNGIATTIANKADLVSGAVAVSQGGTGAKTPADARTNLGFIDGALPVSLGGTGKKSVSDAKSAMEISFLRNTQSWSNMESIINSILPNGGTASLRDNTANVTIYQYSTAIVARNSDTYSIVDINHSDGNVLVAAWASGKTPIGNVLWGTKNTTVDSNGFVKKASPVTRVFNGDVLPSDYALSGFVRAGQCMFNDEAEGVEATRVNEGVYELTGSLGLANDGWTIEIPQDENGYRQIYVQTSFSEGVLRLKTYHRVNSDAPEFLRNVVEGKVDGDPIDIPSGRWVDLRLSMPTDSAFHKRMQQAVKDAEIGSSNVLSGGAS